MSDGRCGDCIFFHPDPRGGGHCRYNPPTVHATDTFVQSYWPKVDTHEWCGRFSARIGPKPRGKRPAPTEPHKDDL